MYVRTLHDVHCTYMRRTLYVHCTSYIVPVYLRTLSDRVTIKLYNVNLALSKMCCKIYAAFDCITGSVGVVLRNHRVTQSTVGRGVARFYCTLLTCDHSFNLN